MSKFTPGSLDDFIWNIWDFNSESGEWQEYQEKIGALIRARDRERYNLIAMYVTHLPGCEKKKVDIPPETRCTCGLDSVLRDLG